MILFETPTYKVVEVNKSIEIHTRQTDKFGNVYYTYYATYPHFTDVYGLLKEIKDAAQPLGSIPTP